MKIRKITLVVLFLIVLASFISAALFTGEKTTFLNKANPFTIDFTYFDNETFSLSFENGFAENITTNVTFSNSSNVLGNEIEIKHWFRFNESSGNLYDVMNSSIFFKGISSPTYQQPTVSNNTEYSIYLDGTAYLNSSERANDNLVPDNVSWCYLFWANITDISDTALLDSRTNNGNSYLYVNAKTNAFTVRIVDTSGTTRQNDFLYTIDTAKFFGFCWNTTHIRVHINGSYVGSGWSFPFNISQEDAGDLHLGSINGVDHITGWIDEFMIVQKKDYTAGFPLTNQQMQDLYRAWMGVTVQINGENVYQSHGKGISDFDSTKKANLILKGGSTDFTYNVYSNVNRSIDFNLFNATYSYGIDNCSDYVVHSYNFTVRNETDSNRIKANIEGTFNFTLNGSVYNTYSIDETKINNFSICIYPNWTSLSGDYELNYEATNYPQRTKTELSAVYDDSTSLIDLFLLYAGQGIYVRFRVTDQYDNVISGVQVDMRISGETSISESQTTDDSGLATFWVNPDETYQFTFRKTGYTTYVTSLRPTSSEIYNVYLESQAKTIPDIPARGTTYSFSPSNQLLNNQTSYDFQFNYTSDYWEITDCNFRLKNASNVILSTIAGTFNSSDCGATITYNTQNLTSIIAEALVEQNSTSTITYTNSYSILYSYEGQFSIKNLIDDLTDFSEAGFNDNTRLLIAFITILIITIFAAKFAGLANPDSMIILIILLIWGFSYISWLNLNIDTIPSSFTFITQYGIAVLATLFGGGYIAWRHT